MTEEIYDRLDEALDALAGRGPGVESFPATPGLKPLLVAAPELKPLLVAADNARQALAARPSPQTRAKHLVTIMDAARAHAPQVVWGRERKRRRRWLLRPIAALALAGALALAPTMAFAANADPGGALYGTKLAIEKVRLLIETDTAGDVGLHLEFAEARMAELSGLAAEGRTDEIGNVVANLAWHNRAASRGVAKLKSAGQRTEALEAALAANLSRHIDVLTGLSEKANCDASDPSERDPQCKGLLNAIENSSKVLEHNPPGLSGETGSSNGGSEGHGEGTSSGNKPASPGPPASPPGRP